MPLGQSFAATPIVGSMNYHFMNNSWSNTQLNAQNFVKQDAVNTRTVNDIVAGLQGMDLESPLFGDLTPGGFVGESPLVNGVASSLNEFISYSESTVDGMVYTITGLGSSLYGGFRNMTLDMKYNKGWAGYGRWYPGKHDPIYAYGFTFKDGFVPEVLDQGNLSWINGKRVINGTLGILFFPMEFANTGYRGLNIIIDQAITGGVSYGIGTGLNKIPND